MDTNDFFTEQMGIKYGKHSVQRGSWLNENN